METYNQHIELINNYLNEKLSASQRSDVEVKLQNDSDFKTLFDNHVIFLKGLERIQLKTDIQNARRTFRSEKWLKASGVAIIIIGALIMLYTLVFNVSTNNPAPIENNQNTILIDTVKTQKETDASATISEEKTTSKDSDSTFDVGYTTTTVHARFGSATYRDTDLKKRAQALKINSHNDTVVRCQEGTLLHIPRAAFVNPKTGKTAQGVIDLKVTEYYELSDILLANLSTSSNGKQLETGGMLYIEATQGNTNLELHKNALMEISFPRQSNKQGMQLFSGEWEAEHINWNLEAIEELETLDITTSETSVEEAIEVPFSIVEQAPTFPGCDHGDNNLRRACTAEAISNFIMQKFNTDVALGLGLTGRQRINCLFKIDRTGNVIFIQTRAAHPRLSNEAERVLNLLPKMLPGMQRGRAVTVPYSLPILFTLESDTTVPEPSTSQVTVDSIVMSNPMSQNNMVVDSIYNERRGMVELIREVMHDKDFPVDSLFIQEWEQYKKQRLIRELNTLDDTRYVLRKPLFEMANSKFKILEEDSITRGGHVIRTPWDASKVPTTTRVLTLVPKQQFTAGTEAVTAEEFEARLNSKTDTSITSRDASYYVLKTSKLGWINCDRFINGRTKRIKYKLKIKNDEGVNVNMVFKAYNSVLPSWYWNGYHDFQTVSSNEPIVLVAIKKQNGQLFYDMVETQTEVAPDIDFQFKEVSIDELKKLLEPLGNVKD